MKPRLSVHAVLVACLFNCLLMCAVAARAKPPAAPADKAQAPLAAAAAALAGDDLPAALAAARKAVAASPANHQAHYYLAYVLFKQEQFGAARAAVQDALRFAPPGSRDDLQKLAKAIQSAHSTSSLAAQAEAAQAEGLQGKAAALWRQAWEADRKQAASGLRAAQLYAQALAQPVSAAQILRELAAKADDPSLADKATHQLALLAPQLATLAENQFQAALAARGATRLALLQEVTEADPNFLPAYELRALTAARGRDLAALKNVLRELSQRGKLDLAMLGQPEFAPLLADSNLALWLEDLAGAVAVRKLLAGAQDAARQREAQAGLQRAQARYQADLDAYQAALRLHRQHAPCMAAAQESAQACQAAVPALRRGLFGMGGNARRVQAEQAACASAASERAAKCDVYPAQAPVMPVKPVLTTAGAAD